MKKETFIKGGARKSFSPRATKRTLRTSANSQVAVAMRILPSKQPKKAGAVLGVHKVSGRTLEFYYGKNLNVYWHIYKKKKAEKIIFNQMAEADGMPSLSTAKRNYNSSNKAHRLFYSRLGDL